jgi:hypothetical protein
VNISVKNMCTQNGWLVAKEGYLTKKWVACYNGCAKNDMLHEVTHLR